MLGLRHGTVALAHHTPDWTRAFADERHRLDDSGGCCDSGADPGARQLVLGLLVGALLLRPRRRSRRT